jgi:curli biogenesis system outer membrane secretion channel CsgG
MEVFAMRTTLLMLLCALSAGCGGGGAFRMGRPSEYVKPTVAVVSFENRASFEAGWDLGRGFSEVLVDRLLATDRFRVVSRDQLPALLQEVKLQHSGVTWKGNRAEIGRIRNVQYLVKGVVTDFGHVASSRGFLGVDNLALLGGSRRAVIAVTVQVIDVETSEIVCSESLEESVRAGDLSAEAAYKNVSFGGSVFQRTPLGRATHRVLDRAVRRITAGIADRRWRPKVAQVRDDGTVILSGGRDRRLRPGLVFEIRRPGEPIIDPDSGDILGRADGRTIATARLVEVRDAYAIATLTCKPSEPIQPGQPCRPAPR